MNKSSGFSLIELCVAIAIMGVLSAIAIPNMIGWRANTQLNGAARDVISTLQYCRVEAARRGAAVAVDFDSDGNGVVDGPYIAWVDDGQGTGDAEPDGVLDGADDGIKDADEVLLFERTLPPRVSVTNLPFGAGLGLTSFNTRAMPRWTGDVVLENSRGRVVTVELYSGGGIEVK